MEVVKNKYGFFELLNKPTQVELDLYYSKEWMLSLTGQSSRPVCVEKIKYNVKMLRYSQDFFI